MDNLQDTQQHEMKLRFADDIDYRQIDIGHINSVQALIDDFNYTAINSLLSHSKYIKRAGIQPLKPIYPIIEHVIKPIPQAFIDCIVGPYSSIPHAETIPLEAYRRIQSEQPVQYTKTVKVNQTKTKENTLHLGTHTRCLCAETGISFGVALPSPLDTSMTLLHPFAFHANVVSFIKQYQKHGIPLAQLDSAALAGMLITILKHKGYASCRDYIAANARLSRVNKKSLTWALAYFYRAHPRQHLPQFNLLAEGNPTTQLIGFIQICKGEDTTVQALHLVEKKQATVKAKVYQTAEKKEAAELKNDVRTCIDLLEKLCENNSTVSDELRIVFEQRIRKLAIYTDQAKEILITDLIGAFGENTATKQLELIIRTNDMTATQKELLTFSMEVAKEIGEFQTEKKKEKIDFAALMGRKKDDNNG